MSHLKEDGSPASAPPTSKRTSAFILSAPLPTAFPAGSKIDGVEAPNKLSKGIIIDKGIEYIRVLKSDRAALEHRLVLAEQLINEVPAMRALYERRLASNIAVPSTASSAYSSEEDNSPGGPNRRSMYAVFAGVSLVGATGLSFSSPDTAAMAQAGSSRVWSGATELVKRAAPFVNSTPSSVDVPVPAAMPALGVLAIIAWILVISWFLLSTLVVVASGRPSDLSMDGSSKREKALRMLDITEQAREDVEDASAELRNVARAREALLILSGAPRFGFAGAILGLFWEGLVSYLTSVGWRSPRGLGNGSVEDVIERACALVRLAEIETAFGMFCCSASCT